MEDIGLSYSESGQVLRVDELAQWTASAPDGQVSVCADSNNTQTGAKMELSKKAL